MLTAIVQQANSYLDYCETIRNFTEQTMKSKRYIILRFVTEIGVDNAEKITNIHFNNWRVSLLQQGVSPRTVNTRAAHAIAFMKYMKECGMDISINLAFIKDIACDPVDKEHFAPQQIKQVMQKCRTEREYLLIAIKFETGLRIAELASLRVEQIDGNAIKVVGKGRKIRTTYMLDETKTRLKRWLDYAGIENGYIFPSPLVEGQHLSIDQIRTTMKAVFRRAGVEKFHPHALRHSFATALYTNGADPFTVQKLLGHSNLAVTTRYLHTMDNQLQDKHSKYMSYA